MIKDNISIWYILKVHFCYLTKKVHLTHFFNYPSGYR